MARDCIFIRDLFLRCIIGMNPEERDKRQDIVINICMQTDLSEAAQTDDIRKTIDYKKLKLAIVELVEESSFLLIEKLADAIARLCLAHPMVEEARVKLEKPGALRFAKSAGVEISRNKKEYL